MLFLYNGKRFSFIFFLLIARAVFAQTSIIISAPQSKEVATRLERAYRLLSAADTNAVSAFWPNVQPTYFFDNIRQNLEHPNAINQGRATNFCGYAALTHLLLRYRPDLYVESLLNLYQNNKTKLSNKDWQATTPVLMAAGTLRQKGELDFHHADQLWFLALADHFKGYMNIIDHRYHPGDENKIWAGTNYSKFNKMLRAFSKSNLKAKGTDFIKPMVGNNFKYLSEELSKGLVLLFINNNHLYPHKHAAITLRAPTHFIVLYSIAKQGDLIQLQYWDYGYRTALMITEKRLQKLIFGITSLHKAAE
jgi:hypothetical protein